jgi:hypothetical protein
LSGNVNAPYNYFRATGTRDLLNFGVLYFQYWTSVCFASATYITDRSPVYIFTIRQFFSMARRIPRAPEAYVPNFSGQSSNAYFRERTARRPLNADEALKRESDIPTNAHRSVKAK